MSLAKNQLEHGKWLAEGLFFSNNTNATYLYKTYNCRDSVTKLL